MKKSLVLALVAVLVLSFASMAFAADFTDTTSHWAKAYINALVGKNVVSGTTATTFVPDGKVTRAEFAKMIVGAKGLALENPATATFSDVATTAWYFPYVEAAAKAKYIDGVGNGKFDPTALVTREQVAKIVVLAAGLKADDTKALNFDDKASISDWAKGFVAVAADAKLVTGYNGKFSPKANATRAEAAKLTYEEMKYEGKIVEADKPLPEGVISKDLKADAQDVEVAGKNYSFAGTYNIKFAGKFNAAYKSLLIKGTPVVLSFDDKDKVVQIEGNPTLVEGKLETKGTNADGRTVSVDGKTLVYVKSADEKSAGNSVAYGDLKVNTSYKFVQNKDGKVYVALPSSAERKTGAITTIGYKQVDSKDQYYLAIDSTNYNLKKDTKPSTIAITVDGKVYDNTGWIVEAAPTATQIGDTWNKLDTDMAATIELNGSGEVTKVTAFNNEQTGKTTKYADKKFARFVEVDGDVVWVKDVVKVGDIYVGKYASQNKPTEGNEVTGLVLQLSSSATIKVDGANATFPDDIKGDKYARLTVTGEGIVTKFEVTKGTAKGQVQAVTYNDDDKLTEITVGGVKYTVDTDKVTVKKDTTDEIKAVKHAVSLELNVAGEVVKVTNKYVLPLNKDDEVKTFTVVATPFEKGRPVTGTDDAYSKGGTIRVMNSSGAAFTVRIVNTTDADVVKNGAELKIGDIKKGDSIAVDVELVTEAAANLEDGNAVSFVIVAPAIK